MRLCGSWGERTRASLGSGAPYSGGRERREKTDLRCVGFAESRTPGENPENAVLSQGPPPVAGEDLPDGRSLPPDRLGEKMAAYGVFGVVDGLKQAENSVWR